MADAHRLTPEELLAHVAWMRRLARALVYDADEAEDLAQEGLHAALARPPLADRPVRPWLAGVLRNLARLRLRGGSRRARREAAAPGETESASPEAMAERVEAQRLVAALVLALDEPVRSTLLLRYYEGRSAAQIAREQGVPAGTVRWRVKQGLDRVRAELDRAHDGDRRRWRALFLPLALGRRPAPVASPGRALLLVAAAALLVLGTRAARVWPWGQPAARAARVTAARLPVRLAASGRGVRVTATAVAEPSGDLRLVGQVIDPAEAPVVGAVVAIDAAPPRAATTDENGRFSFTGLRPRTYRLEAQAGELYAGPVATRPGTPGEPVVLRARPAGAVVVEVRAARGGAPVAGARVELRGALMWRGETDARGEARLAGVGAGWRPLRVEADGFAPAALLVVTRAAPGVERVAVRLEPGAAVTGRVLGPDGAPVAGARVWARSSSEPFPLVDPALDAVTSDAAGRWRIGALAAGSYQFIASHPELAQSATKPRVVGAGGLDGVDIRLDAGGVLAGDVRDPDGRPVASAQVRAAALSDTTPAEWQDVREAFTDAAGHFRLSGLARGLVQVIALHDAGASAMQSADVAAAAEARVTLVLSVRGSIEGVVVDGRGAPVAEAQVMASPGSRARPGRPNPWDLRGLPTLVSDAGGRFRFAGVPDGEYALRAVPPGVSPETMELQPATAARSGDAGVKVVVRDLGTITGRVAFADGATPERFAVQVGRETEPVDFPGGDGRFSVSAPAGTQRLTVAGAFVGRSVEAVRVQEGAVTDVGVITVDRGRAIAGRVTAADGTPVAGAQVAVGPQITGSGTKLFISTESPGARETTTDGDGRFSVPGFEPRAQVAVADAEGRGRSAPVVIRGAGDAQVELVLGPTGSLEGHITRDGRPFADTVIVASPALGRMNFFVTSGPDGHFALDVLAPGRYRVSGFLGRTKDQYVQSVDVRAGERASVELDVRSGDMTATVTVARADGAPVEAARVALVSAALAVPPGASWDDLPDVEWPAGPVLVRLRAGAASIAFDELTAGTYTACASQARPGARLACVTRDVRGSTEIEVTVPGR